MKAISISKWVAATENQAMKQNFSSKISFPFFASVIFLFAVFDALAQVNVPIGNLAPGERVTITFDVTVANPLPAGVSAVTNQGTVSGSNFSTVNTDDPQTGTAGDATITQVESPPALNTLAATAITPTSAVLNGSINPNDLASGGWFQFGVTTNYGNVSATNTFPATNGTIPYNAPIANLTPGTLYHFRAAGTNSGGTTFGNDVTFTTIAIPPPQLSNLAKTNAGPFQFSFTNTAGQTFSVLATTNVALPGSNWTLLGPATEGPAGQYKFSDPQAATNSRRFYRVRSP